VGQVAGTTKNFTHQRSARCSDWQVLIHMNDRSNIASMWIKYVVMRCVLYPAASRVICLSHKDPHSGKTCS
jgi:hypothetical protein